MSDPRAHHHITAHYDIEEFTFSAAPQEEITVAMQYATTTHGGPIVVPDVTGQLIWPATYLLCQFLLLEPGEGSVLELGCGCGMVGAVAMKYHRKRQDRNQLWVSTDMDATALTLCQQNFLRNGITCDVMDDHGSMAMVQALAWGKESDIESIRDAIPDPWPRTFDRIVAADIIYPSTCQGPVLSQLFDTIEALLSTDHGTCYISFCNRDRTYATLSALIDAASTAGFAIAAVPEDHPIHSSHVRQRLPPLLDAQILVLRREPRAAEHNARLGTMHCTVFPGLQAAIQRRHAQLEEGEELWDAPPVDDDDGSS
jgi:cyclopropane fatty-acyl-phospholipid synthase-like methyltransferase